MAVGQKSVPKVEPYKWQHGLKPAVSWWFNFDPYPNNAYLFAYKDVRLSSHGHFKVTPKSLRGVPTSPGTEPAAT